MDLINPMRAFIVILGALLSQVAVADGSFSKSVKCDFFQVLKGKREILPDTFSMKIEGDIKADRNNGLSPLANSLISIGDLRSVGEIGSVYMMKLNSESTSLIIIKDGLILNDSGFWIEVITKLNDGTQTSRQNFVCQ